MNTRFHKTLGALMLLGASAALAETATSPAASADAAPAGKSARTIQWDELLPTNQRDGSNAQGAPLHDYLGGGPAAMQSGSYGVNPALDGTEVRIPGFVVPLDVGADRTVKEFFLVPYFGACIHVPPPPPNQIVYVKLAKGVKIDSLYDAQWVTGRLHTETKSSRFGAAAYTLDGDKVEPYKY